MTIELKGNYFEGNFHYSSISGPDSAETYFERFCPADLDLLLYQCPIEYRHVERVIESAKKGFQFWRKVPIQKRIEALKRYQQQLIARRQDFEEAIILETGKALLEAQEEVQLSINKIDIATTESLKRIAEVSIEHLAPNMGQARIAKKPIGPCLMITTSNLPLHLPNGEMVACLLAGNSVILKPSEKAVYTAQLMIECFHAADFPQGVINFVAGNEELTRRLIRDHGTKGIYFTGTKEVGKKILEYASDDLSKMVSLSLGSKNACIIDKTADINRAIHQTIRAAYKTTGQRCTATSFALVHKNYLDQFLYLGHQLAKDITIGHPKDQPAPTIGPLLDQRTMDNYLLYMGMAKREGHEEIMRGKALDRATRGYYVSPSIHLAQKFDPHSIFLQTEIFGPSLTVIPFESVEEAVSISNATEFGLATSVYTGDKDFLDYCISELECGQVNINCPTIAVNSRLPFSGIKNSGNYHPGGVSAIDHSVHTRTIYWES